MPFLLNVIIKYLFFILPALFEGLRKPWLDFNYNYKLQCELDLRVTLKVLDNTWN